MLTPFVYTKYILALTIININNIGEPQLYNVVEVHVTHA